MLTQGRASSLIKYHSVWNIRHLRKNPRTGLYEIIWSQRAIDENILHDTGEIAILSAFFATTMSLYGTPPANHYLGLDKRVSLAEADTLATLDEITKSGYERKVLSSAGTGASGQDFYINKPAAYYRAESAVVEWTAGEDWIDELLNIFLATHLTAVADANDTHLICSLALSAGRTLLNGDKLQGSMYIGLSE